ncbi:MAG: S-adenosyl-l-methionine hydroxide adenosyltransferase family protein [Burkholderiales bacterium]
MPIYLFTDFGAADIYVGQLKSVLYRHAPDAPVIDLLHEADPFNVRAGAHLLAALAAELPAESVTLAVIDPGVGGARAPVMLRADDRWFVGPDNGLLSVVAARARSAEIFPVTWIPEQLSASFHGRDLFAPVAAAIASGRWRAEGRQRTARLAIEFGAGDLAEIVYIDHYGNAFTGLRARGVSRDARLAIGGRRIAHARVFSEALAGAAFWYENSIGLLEIAANGASAARGLGLEIGMPVAFAV